MLNVTPQGAVDVVRLTGPLNHESAGKLVEGVESGLTDGQPMIVLDLSDVPLLDSAALDALLDLHDWAQLRGGTVKLASLSPLCADVLRVTGVSAQFQVFKDVKLAVGSFVQ
jgi:anti-anti-sigma factor